MTWIDRKEIIIGKDANLAGVTRLEELQVNTTNSWVTAGTLYSAAQTNGTLLAPATGKKIVMHSLFVSTKSINNDIDIRTGSGTQLFYLYTSQSQTSQRTDCNKELATNDPVVIACGAKTFVCASYHEGI
jgi:hypothetical protein